MDIFEGWLDFSDGRNDDNFELMEVEKGGYFNDK